MGFEAREVSEASGVPVATVYRAVKNGTLDLNNARSVSFYVVGNVMLKWVMVPNDWTTDVQNFAARPCGKRPVATEGGVFSRGVGYLPSDDIEATSDKGIEERIDPTSILGVMRGISEKPATEEMEEAEKNEFSEDEEKKILWMERTQKVTREKAEEKIRKNREAYGVDRLDREQLDRVV